VKRASGDSVTDVGAWTQNVNQTFKITVNTTVLGTNDNTVSFTSTSPGVTSSVSNVPSPFASGGLRQMGYVLTGIDAGIMVSNTWSMFRTNDVP
jgi:hypothetical protein